MSLKARLQRLAERRSSSKKPALDFVRVRHEGDPPDTPFRGAGGLLYRPDDVRDLQGNYIILDGDFTDTGLDAALRKEIEKLREG